jgi:hypothetical protein
MRFDRSYLASGIVSAACLVLVACGGSHAEYASNDNPWIGKRAKFATSMAYITNLPGGYSDKEVSRIGRVLDTLYQAEQDKQFMSRMKDVAITRIPEDTAFEIVAVFTVVHQGYTRAFAHDYDVFVLRDGEEMVSAILASEFRQYASGPAGGTTR